MVEKQYIYDPREDRLMKNQEGLLSSLASVTQVTISNNLG